MTHDPYKLVPTPEGTRIEPCPVCYGKPELWRYSKGPDAPTKTAVMCSNCESFGPQGNIVDSGCLLHMPPNAFYHGTIREAVKYWNEYALALNDLRLKNVIRGFV